MSKIKTKVYSGYISFLDEMAEEKYYEPDDVLLYPSHEIYERYETHEMEEYLPNYIPIGNDSGDNEILLKLDGSKKVYMCDPGCFSKDEKHVVLVNISFDEWIKQDCILPKEKFETLPYPIEGSIWLISNPANGLKDFLKLKKSLALNFNAKEMKDALSILPFCLKDQGNPFSVSRKLSDNIELLKVLGYSINNSREIVSFETNL